MCDEYKANHKILLESVIKIYFKCDARKLTIRAQNHHEILLLRKSTNLLECLRCIVCLLFFYPHADVDLALGIWNSCLSRQREYAAYRIMGFLCIRDPYEVHCIGKSVEFFILYSSRNDVSDKNRTKHRKPRNIL